MRSRPALTAFLSLFVCLALLPTSSLLAAKAKEDTKEKKEEDTTKMKKGTFDGLALRGIGPAVASGRIGDIAIHPDHQSTWYIAAASGGVWKTTNEGTTWTPIFDDQGSYSIGCLAIDPKDPLTIWIGTGENNSQRSVGYGDGVYKSTDSGKTWKNVGLKSSEHIGKILIDPKDSKIVYVAAQGPLWAKGGDRGLYKTTDSGATWNRVLTIDDYTGVSDIVMDPRDSGVIYASAYQRFRRVWALIDGGPGSGIHKSVDGGATWNKLENGLPKEMMGRIGLAVSPAAPDTVYAIIEAAGKDSGFYRSTDGGGNWKKMGDHVSTSPQYYQEIVADPEVPGRVYSLDTYMMVTEDGGKTFKRAGEDFKHVDNHALWIDPEDNDHLLVGCDGGLYESFDRAATWRYTANLPITQFYKVAVDEALPFYNLYGGTQDNFTLGGPSRTLTGHGAMNSDWFVTLGGDGFQSRVDPTDPNIVYSQLQHGVLVRFDRRSGEAIDIQPQEMPGDEPYRWNWDSALILSPHDHRRLYFGANRVFRTDDRGDTWRAISPDLTRQIDRNKLELMEQVWSVDAVAKNRSTSFYGNIVSMDESPLVEGLLYVGTDDGLIRVTADNGATWRKIETFKGVPDTTYVSCLLASRHDRDTIYASFNNHKNGDFKPYAMVSRDRGQTWSSIAGNLPERGSVWTLEQDHIQKDLLFAGTEFGVFFSRDGGSKWIQLGGGMPTIAVRNLAIQRREDDLVVATFGRGFYILDDYAPLREASEEALAKTMLLPVKDAPLYIPAMPLGLREKGFQGHGFFTAPNPPYGAVFTYYLSDAIKTRRETRRDEEKKLEKEKADVFYPPWDALRLEDREEDPSIILTITDEAGNVVRNITGPVKAGFQRVAWDLRYPTATPTSLEAPDTDIFDDPDVGPLVVPGRYRVSIAKRVDGVVTPLPETRTFSVVSLGLASLGAADKAAVLAFQQKVQRLQRAVLGTLRAADEADSRVKHLKKALAETPTANPSLGVEARRIENRLRDLNIDLRGDSTVARRSEPTLPSISDRVSRITGQWNTTQAPTTTQKRNYDTAAARFNEILRELTTLIEGDLVRLERNAETAGAPWTPGRLPQWRPE